ncbi:MAG: chemotaxis protein CheX [Phycisphaerales bacterium]|nr:chemotaxis protein CheX [Phycisphaerales bacterium]
MDPTYISAFVTSIQNVFSTMFQLPVEIGEPRIKTDRAATHDVSGIIGVSGSMVGTIVLSMPTETATTVISLFTGMQIETDSPDFADAVGEIVNMISGGAKATFQRKDVGISCPSVVIGPGHIVSHQSGTPCVLIPCITDCGEVVIEVSLREAVEESAVPSNAA